MQVWLNEVASATVRDSTLHRYRQGVRLYIGPALGHIRLDKLRPQQLAAFYRDAQSHLSSGSVRRLHALLRRSLTVAQRWGHIFVNPATLVEPPPLQLEEVRPLSASEAHDLLTAARQTDLAARWVLGLATGLRQGEVLGLHWEDIDLSQGTLRVQRALQRRSDGRLVEVAPKTARSRRTLPLPASVVTALVDHRVNQQELRSAAGPRWTESDLVFTTRVGTPIHPRNDHRAFVALLRSAGLRRVRLHDLRHTTASLLLSQGVSPRVVMEILGHSQISVTMNTYSHVSPELNRAAAEGMQQALWPAEGES